MSDMRVVAVDEGGVRNDTFRVLGVRTFGASLVSMGILDWREDEGTSTARFEGFAAKSLTAAACCSRRLASARAELILRGRRVMEARFKFSLFSIADAEPRGRKVLKAGVVAGAARG